MSNTRSEYTPIQISLDLGSPIHREAMFQILLTLEQDPPEDERITACDCDNQDEGDSDPPSTFELGDDPLSFGSTPE